MKERRAGQPTLLQPTGDLVVMTLGFQEWCSSNWHEVYYRIWRVAASGKAPELLVNGAEFAYVGDTTIAGRLDDEGRSATIEFMAQSIAFDERFTRPAIRRFVIDSGGARRVPPIALSPRDLVEEWLLSSWNESGVWSEDGDRAALAEWHRKLHKDALFGSYAGATRHCRIPADTWQVSFAFQDNDPIPEAYFRIRWHPLYRMTLLDIAEHPFADCDEDDDAADASERSLLLPQPE
jgi:hypothetical protein